MCYSNFPSNSFSDFSSLFNQGTYDQGFTSEQYYNQADNIYIEKPVGVSMQGNEFNSMFPPEVDEYPSVSSEHEVKPIKKEEKSIFSKLIEKITSIVNAIFSFCSKVKEGFVSTYSKLFSAKEKEERGVSWEYKFDPAQNKP